MRAIVNINNEKNETICTAICLLNGHVSGLGKLIYSILNNGNAKISWDAKHSKKEPVIFGSMGCLGAYIIGRLKTGSGNIVLLKPNNGHNEPYVYTFYSNKKKDIMLEIEAYGRVVFSSKLELFNYKEVEQRIIGLI